MADQGGLRGVLPYDASSSVLEIVGAVDPSVVSISQFRDGNTAGFFQALAESDVLLHVLEPVTAEVMDQARACAWCTRSVSGWMPSTWITPSAEALPSATCPARIHPQWPNSRSH